MRVATLPSSEPAVERIFLLEFTLLLSVFPKSLPEERIKRGIVCASIARTEKILTFMSHMGESEQ